MTAHTFSPSLRSAKRWAVAAACLPLLLTAACGGGSSDGDDDTAGSGSASGADTPAAKLVPEDFKDRTIQIAIASDYPPYHYADENGDIIGFDPEFAKAIAEDMGVAYEIKVSSFDAIIPGIQADRYDFAVPGFSINPERAAVLDFVTYITDQTSYATATANPVDVQSPDDLCGHSWAAQKGTQEEAVLQEQATKCESTGAGELTVLSFPTNNDALTAVLSGRADGVSAVYSQLAYASEQQDGKFEIADYKREAEPLAIGLPKGSELGPAIEQAVKDLQANGTYSEILGNNNVTDMNFDDIKLVAE